MISFASICPHPPLLLPSVGEEKQRAKVRDTIEALNTLERRFRAAEADQIIISSPHRDWGFEVPLFFLAQNFKGRIKKVLTRMKPPSSYFQKGRRMHEELDQDKRYGLIASGDLSHRLKQEGPYGFHPHGPQFDKALIRGLEKKEIKKIMNLDREFPQAGECGLRSICFLLGLLDGSEFQPRILSYQAPFGIGYLVAEFKIEPVL